ncbi:hypothetical protein PZ895_07935 [Mesorhizobium sp. YIM 152430]|uniref:hypothetical protein n=1 Tax=Mesorhizobium sp. YIM 152430 TaxID=3031761 RepID=UPI0023DBBD5B|nr:hypothetical protein [Mesorhizobium sp. YIM 152430]MDF1599705.1 hypothetical protein [Mesorhizobium sp. YIM 152430]
MKLNARIEQQKARDAGARGGARAAYIQATDRLLDEYEQGRAASAVLADMKRERDAYRARLPGNQNRPRHG